MGIVCYRKSEGMGNFLIQNYLLPSGCNSFQCFALIQLLTSGGPNHSTDTIMYYIYYSAFKLYRYGYGDAMGVVLAIIIAILSAIQFKLGNSND